MWQCENCLTKFERLQIAWGFSGGGKVDVLDYSCPSCGNPGYIGAPQLVFLGTAEEKASYWDKEWAGGFVTSEQKQK